MLIRLGYDIRFDIPSPTAIVALLNIHPSRVDDLREPDEVRTSPELRTTSYVDCFGNRCCRLLAPQGAIQLWNSTLIEDSGLPDAQNPEAKETPVDSLPDSTLQFLLASRYCEVDLLSSIALEFFGNIEPGWTRVQAICDWVHEKITFGYNFARPTKTAAEVFVERTGVCRDFQHLAITFCRCLHIPARYATGYLGDIGVPPAPFPMDFSAWFEVYLDNRWWAFDARHNQPRIGRVLMATGRDAADVALTTSFGKTNLTKFEVIADEVLTTANKLAIHVATAT
jgi:transglutaminase-like putative cysteine protease